MPLTPEQRAQAVTFITANCDCWKKQGDKAATTLNAFDDAQLVAVAQGVRETNDKITTLEAVTNALREAASEPGLAVNAMPAFIKEKMKCDPKKDKDCPPEKGEKEATKNAANVPVAEPVKFRTREEFEAAMPPEVLNVWNTAKAVEASERANLTQRLRQIAANSSPARKALIENKLSTNPDVATMREVLGLVDDGSNGRAPANNSSGAGAPDFASWLGAAPAVNSGSGNGGWSQGGAESYEEAAPAVNSFTADVVASRRKELETGAKA
jgi:hypothetical protein